MILKAKFKHPEGDQETGAWVSSSTLQFLYSVPENQNDLQLSSYTSYQTHY